MTDRTVSGRLRTLPAIVRANAFSASRFGLLAGLLLVACDRNSAPVRKPELANATIAAAPPAPPTAPGAARDTPAPQDRSAGFVVWESNRNGAFRIWRQEIGGGPPRAISPVERGRDHCCAALSPDGKRMVYLSVPAGAERYESRAGALHLADADGGRDRVLGDGARDYGEHRAAVWWDADTIVHLDAAGNTIRRTLSTGETQRLATPPASGEGWLVAPGGRFATGNTPTFSELVPGRGLVERPSIGGCQPAFAADGARAVWSAGAGGPIDAIDLATRRTWTILEKNDPHLPEGRRYAYFPQLSADTSLLALGASNGEHDHFRADYDVFVVELDPATLTPEAPAIAIAPDPAIDRFPDAFRAPTDRPAVHATTNPAASPTTAASARERALEAEWVDGDPSRVGGATILVRPTGRAWYDRNRAMALDGGAFATDAAVGDAVAAALRNSNQLSLALTLSPATLDQAAPIVALSDGGRRRQLVLRQDGRRLELVLATSDTPRGGAATTLGELADTAPIHLVVTFSPGRLAVWIDGERRGAVRPFAGDFFAWKAAPLAFGGEGGGRAGEGSWRGTLADFALWSRELDADAVAAERSRRPRRPAAPRAAVEVKVLAVSATPDLRSISPYREALAVDAVELTSAAASSGPPPRFRRVRWAILDGEAQPAPRPGDVERIVVEPFDAQPQLEPLYLADDVSGETEAGPLWFDLGGSAAP